MFLQSVLAPYLVGIPQYGGRYVDSGWRVVMCHVAKPYLKGHMNQTIWAIYNILLQPQTSYMDHNYPFEGHVVHKPYRTR